VYDRLLEHDPNNAEAWNGMGYVRKAQGRYQEAIACIEKALALAPNEANFLDSMGDMRIQVEEYVTALQSLDESLKRSPEFSAAWRKKSVALRKLGHVYEAERAEKVSAILDD
jgi:tetratricopeptide (TPR) repeat protein